MILWLLLALIHSAFVVGFPSFWGTNDIYPGCYVSLPIGGGMNTSTPLLNTTICDVNISTIPSTGYVPGQTYTIYGAGLLNGNGRLMASHNAMVGKQAGAWSSAELTGSCYKGKGQYTGIFSAQAAIQSNLNDVPLLVTEWTAPGSGNGDIVFGLSCGNNKPSANTAGDMYNVEATVKENTMATPIEHCPTSCSFVSGGTILTTSTTTGFNVDFAVQMVSTMMSSKCQQRICFRVNISDATKWYTIGLSDSGVSMPNFEKMIMGFVGTKPFVYHASAGNGYNSPASIMNFQNGRSCLSGITLSGTTLTFSRPMDATTCVNPGIKLTPNGTFNVATVEGHWVNTAVGTSTTPPGMLPHQPNPPVSSGVVFKNGASFTATAGNGATIANMRIHGLLMVLAWIFFTPTAVVSARYMRKLLEPRKESRYNWFKIHRNFQMLAGIFTLSSVWYISSKTGGNLNPSTWSGNKIHQRLGVSVLALTLLQVLMGVFRNRISGMKQPRNAHTTTTTTADRDLAYAAYEEDKDTQKLTTFVDTSGTTVDGDEPYGDSAVKTAPSGHHDDHGPHRWLFNYVHRGLGLLTWSLAISAVYYGLTLFEQISAVSMTSLQSAIIAWVVILISIALSLDLSLFKAGEWGNRFVVISLDQWISGGLVVVLTSLIVTVMIITSLFA